ncbi:glucose 1-dehydrogenase [Microdochium nivale]|nr:glucose 1-dehydrogenase [Microdochium nivale]
MATSMQGKTVIVTGGASGLGKVIATAYLDAGANVAVCDVNEARLKEVAGEFDSTGRFLSSKADVTDEASVQAFVQSVVDKFGQLDILVNNAGIMDSFAPVGVTTKASWDLLIGVNLTGSFLAMKAAVNAMEKKTGGEPGGLIIQIGSTAGDRGLEAGLAYTVSKHGVNGLVKHTAGAYRSKGIYAVGLMLGGMATNIREGMAKSGDVDMDVFALTDASNMTAADMVDIKDVAKYCLFLSDRSIAATANGGLITFRKNFPFV